MAARSAAFLSSTISSSETITRIGTSRFRVAPSGVSVSLGRAPVDLMWAANGKILARGSRQSWPERSRVGGERRTQNVHPAGRRHRRRRGATQLSRPPVAVGFDHRRDLFRLHRPDMGLAWRPALHASRTMAQPAARRPNPALRSLVLPRERQRQICARASARPVWGLAQETCREDHRLHISRRTRFTTCRLSGRGGTTVPFSAHSQPVD